MTIGNSRAIIQTPNPLGFKKRDTAVMCLGFRRFWQAAEKFGTKRVQGLRWMGTI